MSRRAALVVASVVLGSLFLLTIGMVASTGDVAAAVKDTSSSMPH